MRMLNFSPDERGLCHRTDFMGFFFEEVETERGCQGKIRNERRRREGVCVAARLVGVLYA